MTDSPPGPEDPLSRIFPGDSELAVRMRGFNWSTTPLGHPGSWPQNLRGAVAICLTSPFPLFLWWGPSLTMLYNDASISFLGKAKHPAMLGRSGREAWTEVWSTIGPLCDEVLKTGKPGVAEDLLMFFDRRLPKEEVYVTFSYGPIFGNGTVDGIFGACSETTEQLIGARRLATLRKLGVEAGEARTGRQACAAAAAVLADNPNDVPFAAIYIVNRRSASAELSALTSLPDVLAALPPRVSVGDINPDSPWPLAFVLRSKQPAEIADVVALPGGAWAEPAHRALVLPIRATTRGQLAGLLVAAASPRQPLDEAYRTFFDLVAAHIGRSLAEASAFEPERHRVADSLPDGVDTTVPVGPAAERPSGRILVADDNPDMREYLRQLLSNQYEVRAIADGEAALAAIREAPPDLVIADVMTPGLDGFGLLRALRATPATRTLPVMLLSARAGGEPEVEALAAGAVDYLVKPFHDRELLGRVSARLEIVRLTREAVERERAVRKTILDSMADRYYALDAQWRYKEFNAHAEAQLRALGKDPTAMIGKALWDEFPNPPNEELLRRAMASRQPHVHEHYYDPLAEWVQNRIDPSDDGGIVIFQRYVTEAKRLEHQLRRTAGYLADAEALSHTGTWAWNPTTRELFWSAEHFKIFGLDSAVVTPTYEVAVGAVHPDDRALVEETFNRAMANLQPHALNCRIVRPDGEIRHIRTLAHPVMTESGALAEYVGSVIDMTESVHADEALRRSQEELAQVTRVMTLGALTASIGHDLNQFVVAIVTNASACLGWLARDTPNLEEAAAAVRRITRDAGLIGDVIGNIRAFLSKTAEPRMRVDVTEIVREVRQLVNAEATRQRVVIDEACADTLPPVLGVRIELQQVLLNLTMNAIEAMADVLDRPRVLHIRCEPYTVEHGSGVLVTVQDSGGGFGDVDPRRLYDVLYTTKPTGLGMGLSIARAIVQGYGGRLWATPNPTHGVSFYFTIPPEPRP
jgi:CheY-like chemotaxis protein